MAVHPLFETILETMCPQYIPNPEFMRPDYTARIAEGIDFPGLDRYRLVAVYGDENDDDAVAAPITPEQEHEWFDEGVEFAAYMPQGFVEELANRARLVAQRNAERKPMSIEMATLEQKLAASIALVNARKGAA